MKLIHPFTCIISGPSGSGKSSLVVDIILEKQITPPPRNIVWLYAEDQPLYKKLPTVKFIRNIPDDIETRFRPTTTNLLVIDDLMTKAHNDDRLTR